MCALLFLLLLITYYYLYFMQVEYYSDILHVSL